jgi:predicted RNase H-like nuclease (RuvC/YqgF family)
MSSRVGMRPLAEGRRQFIEAAMNVLIGDYEREIVSLREENKKLSTQNNIMKASIENQDAEIKRLEAEIAYKHYK